MKIEIEINDLVGFQFKSDDNEVIHFEDMSRREQIKVLNSFVNGYELFFNSIEGGIVIKMYIARDEDGKLFLFNAQPYRVDWKYPCKVWESEEDYMRIKDELYPEVTFENSPKEVELVLKK